MKTYEGMFLLDAGNPDFEASAAPVREVLTRIGAEVLALKPWDDRKLAYEIKGRKRGLYVLTYFRADPSQIAPLQHEVQLEERILRAMFLNTEGITPERINADTPATARRTVRAGGGEADTARGAGETAPPDRRDDSPRRRDSQDATGPTQKESP